MMNAASLADEQPMERVKQGIFESQIKIRLLCPRGCVPTRLRSQWVSDTAHRGQLDGAVRHRLIFIDRCDLLTMEQRQPN